MTGELTATFYDEVDRESRGEPVFWVGIEPAPYWLIAAREYCERWVHHQQIARAVGSSRPHDMLLLRTSVAALLPVFAARFGDLDAPDGTSVMLQVADVGRWMLCRGAGVWKPVAGAAPHDAACALKVSLAASVPMFSKGSTIEEIKAAMAIEGDLDLAVACRSVIAELLGRPEGTRA